MNRHEQDMDDTETQSRAARGIVSIFGRHAVVRLLAFLGTLILARLIAPESFGLFVAAQFSLAVLQGLTIGGITTALVRRRERIDKEDWCTARTLQQGLATVMVIGMWVAAPFVVAAYGLSEDRSMVFRVLALAVFAVSLRSIPMAMLQRGLRHDLIAVCEVIEYAVYLATAIGLAVLGADVWALVAATLVRHFVGAVAVQAAAGGGPGFGFEWHRAKALIGASLPLQGQILIDLAQRSVVPVVVGLMFGMAAVGVVGMANGLLEALVLQPLTMIASVQLRLFARVQHDKEAMRRQLEVSVATVAMVLLPALVLLALFSPVLFPHLFSERWEELGKFMSLLVPVAAIQMVASPLSQAAKALGVLTTPLVAGLANLAIQLAVLGGMASAIGLYAYPLAAAAGGVVGTGLILRGVARRIDHLPVGGWGPIALATVAGALPWALAARFPMPFGAWGALIVGGGAIYLVCLAFLAGDRVAVALGLFGQVGPRSIRRALADASALLERRFAARHDSGRD